MKTYHAEYRNYMSDTEHSVDVVAKSKSEAYEKAMYEIIPQIEGGVPYSCWIVSVTYSNGNYHRFNNTSEGNAY